MRGEEMNHPGENSMKNWLRSLVIVTMLGLAAGQARAGVVVYTGTDVGAGPGSPTLMADAAAASFAAAAATIGSSSTITFENAPVGSFNNLTVAPGVSINGFDQSNNPLYINNTPNYPADPPVDGFNTTPGGSNYVEMIGGTLTFTFANPTQFFGAFFTGVQNGFFADTITFTDSNGQQSVAIDNAGFDGGVTFVGFTDAGQSITSISVTTSPLFGSGDYIGVDDVSFQSVPEPSTLTLAGIAVAFAIVRAARRKRLAV
jgi:PEP-CTERM motif